MGKKRKIAIPGSVGGLLYIPAEKIEGIVLKPKEAILLALSLILLVWLIRIIF